jgi:hypothetical protein
LKHRKRTKCEGVEKGYENSDGEVNNTEPPPTHKQNTWYKNNEKFSLLVKSSGVIP